MIKFSAENTARHEACHMAACLALGYPAAGQIFPEHIKEFCAKLDSGRTVKDIVSSEGMPSLGASGSPANGMTDVERIAISLAPQIYGVDEEVEGTMSGDIAVVLSVLVKYNPEAAKSVFMKGGVLATLVLAEHPDLVDSITTELLSGEFVVAEVTDKVTV